MRITEELMKKAIPKVQNIMPMGDICKKLDEMKSVMECLCQQDKSESKEISSNQIKILDMMRVIRDNIGKPKSVHLTIVRNDEGLITGITINPEEK